MNRVTKKIIFSLVFVLSIFTTSFTFAQPVETDEIVLDIQVDGFVTSLVKGQPAPFTGVLYDNVAAISLNVVLANISKQCNLLCDEKLKIENLKYKKHHKLIVTGLNTKISNLNVKLEGRNKYIQTLEKKLLDKKSVAWYQTNQFWFGMGVVTSVSVVLLTSYAFASINNI